MKLRTSFFNFGVLRKNLTRFAPLWILFAIGEVLGIMSLDVTNLAYRIVDDLSYIMGPVSIFHAGYALLVAACLFGDLFDARLCNGLHATPMRRDGWLLTNLVSGLVFALIPAIVGGGFAAIVLQEYWWIAIAWQLVSLLQFVFFFGVAVFSALCAGKRIGMIAIYGILNFLSQLIYWAATKIYEPLLPGVVIGNDWYELFSPLVTMVGSMYYDIDINWSEISTKVVFNGYIMESWYYLYACAAVGLVFTGLGWLLYRKRHLETAGDFISFRPMRIFFLIAYTLAAGVVLYSFGDLIGVYTNYGFLVVGLLIGWFTGWMLLERTIKIFNKKVIAGLAVFALLFVGSIGLTIADPLGVVTRVPKTQEIESVCLYPTKDTYMYYSTAYDSGRYVSVPEEVALVQELHRQMLETPESADDEIINIELRYQLKNGAYVYRSYDVPAQSEAAENLRPFLSDTRSVFATNDWQQVKDDLMGVHVYPAADKESFEISDANLQQALLNAIEADCKAGNFAQHDYFHRYQEYVAGIDITWKTDSTGRSPNARNEHVIVYADCVNTVAFLETLDEN